VPEGYENLMKAWIGKTYILIGILHSIVGFVYFYPVLRDLISAGLINTITAGEAPEEHVAS